MKAPAFQFYADDFLAGVSDMTQAEVGAYILLLCHQWGRGEIPSDPARVAMVAKGDVSPHVVSKFPDGKNKRLEEERQKQAEYRARQSANGRAGSQSRWHGDAIAPPSHRHSVAITVPKPNDDSPSPSPSPISESRSNLPPDKPAEKKERRRDPLFDALAQACGCNPLEMTSRDARACGVALAEIRKVCPSVSPADFAARAANYRTHYTNAALTPSALCSHWAACASPNSHANNQPANPRRFSNYPDYSGVTSK